MKKAKLFSSILATALAGILCFSVAACDDDPEPSQSGNVPGQSQEEGSGQTNPPPAPAVSISIGAGAPMEIRKGEQVTLTVTVTNTDNKNYTWSVTDSTGAASDILAVSSENVVTVEKDVQLDTVVTVTATSEADPTKKASHTFTVKPNITGQVGNLTAEALTAISGPNLTVTGTVTDYYEDLQYSANNQTRVYDSVVKMSQDAWYGEFSAQGEGDVISSNYRAGEQYGSLGHALMSVYIDKNNEVAERAETNYQSVPLIWENQHLYNHLGNLGTDISKKFTYDATNDEYIYNIEPSGAYDTDASPDEYLMAYLAVSLTPMLEGGDNFMQFRLKMTGDKITGIWAQTAVGTVTAGDGETVLERSYTEVELTISEVGTTVVPNPAPYEAPDYAEYLEAAIDQMKAADNYTFTAIETSVSAPSYDEGDYEMESVSGGVSTIAAAVPLATDQYYFKHAASRSPLGGTGTTGYVTKDAAVFESIGMYSASMDGQDYNFNYTGYKQHYADADKTQPDYFEVLDDEQVYTSVKGLIGVERRNGNYFEKAMPQWDFAPEIFEALNPVPRSINGVRYTLYTYVLRDTFITHEVTREIAADNNARNGEAMPFSTLTISVLVDADENVTLYQTEYPYGYSDYTGFITTTYSNFGTTELLKDAFNTEKGYYVERQWRDTWGKYTAHDYNPDHVHGQGHDESAETVLRHMFPKITDINSQLPAPSILMELISDDVNGPWFDYSLNDDGTLKREEFSFNCAMNNDDVRLDRNGVVIDIEAILGQDGTLSQEVLKVSGWAYSPSNSGYRTEGNPTSSYFATYVNQTLGIMLVVENNHTKNFFFDFYKMGDWSLNRS